MSPAPTPTPRADRWLAGYDDDECTLDAHATMQELERELAEAKAEKELLRAASTSAFYSDTSNLQRILTNACQLIDGFKNDLSLAPGEWSEFDETTRREVGELLKGTYESKP